MNSPFHLPFNFEISGWAIGAGRVFLTIKSAANDHNMRAFASSVN
jgi:hypothetical protein